MKKLFSFLLLFLSFNSFASGRWIEITTDRAFAGSCEKATAKANDLDVHRKTYKELAVPEHKEDFSLDVEFIGSCSFEGGIPTVHYKLMGYTCGLQLTNLTLAGTCPDEIPSKENCLERDDYTGQLSVSLEKDRERYTDIEGCVFKATGIIVCDSEGKSCAADWKSTGDISKDFFGESGSSGGNSGNQGGTTGNPGGNSGNSGGNAGSSESFDYEKNAQVIQDHLTQKYDADSVTDSMAEIFGQLTESVKTHDENTENSLKGIIDGSGDISSEFKLIDGYLKNIGSNTTDSILFPFFNV